MRHQSLQAREMKWCFVSVLHNEPFFQTKSRDAISIAFVDLDIDEKKVDMNVSFPSSDFVGGKKHLVAEQKTDDKTYTLDSVKEIQECNVHTSYIIKTGLRQVKFSNKIFYCDLIFMFSLKCQQQCLSELIWLLQEKTFFFSVWDGVSVYKLTFPQRFRDLSFFCTVCLFTLVFFFEIYRIKKNIYI